MQHHQGPAYEGGPQSRMLDAQRAQVQEQVGEEMLQDKLLLARRQLPDGQEEGNTS